MIAGIDAVTDHPLITESRPIAPYTALPRSIGNYIRQMLEVGQWTVRYLKPVQGGSVIGCWKCGRPMTGWQRIPGQEVDGKPAVSLGPFGHYRETRLAAYLPRVDRRVVYTVLHCADCVIAEEHGQEALSIHLAAHDQEYLAKRPISRDEWAQRCWPWGDVELREKVSGPLTWQEGI